MKIIFGLGNPGRPYEGTRHNVGYSVLDVLAGEQRVVFKKKTSVSIYAESELAGERILLVKPTTFVNLSGRAVRAHYNRSLKATGGLNDILIVLDDCELPVGALRFREKGSSGGHHGLESIAEAMETEAFPRLRIGVGRERDRAKLLSAYVLERFNASDRTAMETAFQRAKDACLCWIQYGSEKTMQLFNTRALARRNPLS